MKASFDTSVTSLNISVKNDSGDFESFSSDNISLSVNLASLTAGEHIVAVNVSLPDGYSVDGTYRVKVIITRSEQPATDSNIRGTQQAVEANGTASSGSSQNNTTSQTTAAGNDNNNNQQTRNN